MRLEGSNLSQIVGMTGFVLSAGRHSRNHRRGAHQLIDEYAAATIASPPQPQPIPLVLRLVVGIIRLVGARGVRHAD
jgi:hypothetical protein